MVAWLGAVQAQDYLGALWSVGLRLARTSEADVEKALDRGTILRTWPMRGTLHLVPARDARWMLELMAPRVIARSARRHAELGLDAAAFARSRKVLAGALEGGRRLTRPAALALLAAAGISTAGQRGIHILARLAMEGLLCFGPRQGKQQTFVLLEEWVPKPRILARDEALAEVARRYFTGHGPATAADLAWWTGLTAADVRSAVDLAAPRLDREEVAGRTYWSGPRRRAPATGPRIQLLPGFDELLIGYQDRSAHLEAAHRPRVLLGGMLSPTIVVDGQVVGTWRRTLSRRGVAIETALFGRGSVEPGDLAAACERYARFLRVPRVFRSAGRRSSVQEASSREAGLPRRQGA